MPTGSSISAPKAAKKADESWPRERRSRSQNPKSPIPGRPLRYILRGLEKTALQTRNNKLCARFCTFLKTKTTQWFKGRSRSNIQSLDIYENKQLKCYCSEFVTEKRLSTGFAV